MDGGQPRWPDFYIVGAPKAGTTSLYDYLSGHPRIFLPGRKELRYFGSDLEILHRHRFTRDEFLAEYRASPPDASTGNAFVWYLFSRLAAEEIREVQPGARIIVMLRDPVEAIHALHSEFVFDGNEDLDDIADALAAEPDRRAGRRIPDEAHFPAGLGYRHTVAYATQLERFLGAFGDRVHVVLFDDFVRDPATAYRAVLAFLHLEPDGRDAFRRRNPNKRARSALVRRLLARPPSGLRRAIRAVLPAAARRAAYRGAVALNTQRPARAPMPDAVRRQLRAELEPEVVRLEEILGRSLEAWKA